ncbi:MAG: glycoprotease [Oscillospiraceae bacterium]|nr:glycoprotease [Oscillospiraceae bacterium]
MLKQFLPVKQGQLGLRQSDALFHHTVALPKLLQQLAQKVDLTQIAAVGVSEKPRPAEGSYMPCFLAGVSFASAFASARNLPLITTTHQQGHIAAALFACNTPTLFQQPVLVFHVSGGTTELLYTHNLQIGEIVGNTSDLYAGQAVDRVGVAMGFAFPAGAEVSRIAQECEEKIKPRASVKNTVCSLSGLENQCKKLLLDGKDNAYVAKYCLLCIAETIAKIIKNARLQYPQLPVVCAGGVMSSDLIHQYVQTRLENTYFVSGEFSSDNALGVAVIASGEVDNG